VDELILSVCKRFVNVRTNFEREKMIFNVVKQSQ